MSAGTNRRTCCPLKPASPIWKHPRRTPALRRPAPVQNDGPRASCGYDVAQSPLTAASPPLGTLLVRHPAHDPSPHCISPIRLTPRSPGHRSRRRRYHDLHEPRPPFVSAVLGSCALRADTQALYHTPQPGPLHDRRSRCLGHRRLWRARHPHPPHRPPRQWRRPLHPRLRRHPRLLAQPHDLDDRLPSACSRVIPVSCSICVFQLSTRSSRSAARIPTLIDSTMFSLNSLSRSYSSTLSCSER